MPIDPVVFTDAPPGWKPGDPLPDDATPIDAAAMALVQNTAGAYTDAVAARVATLEQALLGADPITIPDGFDLLYRDQASGALFTGPAGALEEVQVTAALADKSVGIGQLDATARRRRGLWLPDTVVDETFTMGETGAVNIPLTSGRIRLTGKCEVPEGETVAAIEIAPWAAFAAGITHLWFALYDVNQNLLQWTGDINVHGHSTWGTAPKKLPLLAPWVAPADYPVYVGVMVASTGSLGGVIGGPSAAPNYGSAGNALTYIAGYQGNLGLTDTPPNPVDAPSTTGAMFYARLHNA